MTPRHNICEVVAFVHNLLLFFRNMVNAADKKDYLGQHLTHLQYTDFEELFPYETGYLPELLKTTFAGNFLKVCIRMGVNWVAVDHFHRIGLSTSTASRDFAGEGKQAAFHYDAAGFYENTLQIREEVQQPAADDVIHGLIIVRPGYLENILLRERPRYAFLPAECQHFR